MQRGTFEIVGRMAHRCGVRRRRILLDGHVFGGTRDSKHADQACVRSRLGPGAGGRRGSATEHRPMLNTRSSGQLPSHDELAVQGLSVVDGVMTPFGG